MCDPDTRYPVATTA